MRRIKHDDYADDQFSDYTDDDCRLGGGSATTETGRTDNAVQARHTKAAAIIRGHLKEINDDVLRFDPQSVNMDNAGDKAEIARHVLTALVDQLRGFAVGARDEIASEKARQARLPMDELKDRMKGIFRELSELNPGGGVPSAKLIAVMLEQGFEPEVAQALMKYALSHLLDDLLN